MEVTGTIIAMMDAQQITDKFRKQDFVIETEGRYPQKVIFQAVNDKIEKLNQFNEGDKVTVQFNLRGREHNGKYYNTLEAWSIK